MIIKGQLLSATNLNNAYISKTDTNAQSINSTLTISGGALTLKNSTITDNANSTYLRISPQGNNLILYDGVNNQQLSIYSSSGSEYTYIKTVNGTKSIGQIDVSSAIDHLEINNTSKKIVLFGSDVQSNSLFQSNNPSNLSATVSLSWINNDPRIRIGGTGAGALGTFRIQGTSDVDRFTVDNGGNIWNAGTAYVSSKLTASGGVGISGSNLLSFDTYGGGFNMTDATWIRVTGGKSIYQPSGTIRTDGILMVGSTGSFYANTSGVAIGGSTSPRSKLDVIGGGATIGTNLQSPTNVDGSLTLGNTTWSYSGNNNGQTWNGNGSTLLLEAKDYSTIAFLEANNKLDYIRGGSGQIDIGYDGGWGRSNIILTNGIWDNTGKVGINTSSPTRQLDINGDARINGNVYSAQSYLDFYTDAGGTLPIQAGSLAIASSYGNNAPTNGLYVQGNVGIGTSNPAGKMHVIESGHQIYTGSDHMYLKMTANSSYPYIGFLDSGGTRGAYLGSGSMGKYVTLGLENGNNLFVTGGKIGVGTNSPAQSIDVVGNIQNNGTFISNSTSADVFQAMGSSGVKTFRWEGGNLRFYTSQNSVLEAMTLASNGSIGINQASPSYKLDVTGDIRTTTALRATANNTAGLYIGSNSALWDINTANTIAVYGQQNTAVGALKLGSTGPTLYGTGNMLGIGTTSPTQAIDVNGNVRLSGGHGIWSGYNNNYILNDHNNGAVTLSAAGSDLYLGYQNTNHVRFEKPLYTNNGGTLVADTSGKLYYQGNDIDSRYLNYNGDTMNGDLSFASQNNGIGLAQVANGTSPTIRTSGNWITGGEDYAGLNAINNVAVQTWYGFSVSPTITGSAVAQGSPAFSVNARTGDTWIAGSFYPSGGIYLNSGDIHSIDALYGVFGTIAKSYDEYLRINDDGSHTAGIYFGSSAVRTDGNLTAGTIQTNGGTISGGNIVSTGNLTAVNESHLSHGTYADPAPGYAVGLKVAQGFATDGIYLGGSLNFVNVSSPKINLSGNGNPGIELRSLNGGLPYIDFSTDATSDYQARIAYTQTGGYLQVSGAPLYAAYGEVFSKGHNLTFGTSTPSGGSSGDVYIQI